MPTTFWNKWKVFIIGLVGAATLAMQAVLSNNPTQENYRVYAFAALIGILSFVATEWRGKAGTILGAIGTLAGVFVTLQTGGTFTWNQFIISGIIAIGMSFTPPPKPSSYEHDANIVAAKEIPPTDPVVDNSKLPVG